MEDTVNTQATKIKIPEYKGHTEIVLTDVNTGEKTVIEEDNIVTNAVRDFFANDGWGLLDLGNADVLPLRNMFGGVLCFQNRIDENVNNYAVPSDSVNPIIAHAGQKSHSTTSSLRGNPNGIESKISADGRGYTFVWDWTTNQGVGTINTVCLTHSVAGNIGTKPVVEFEEHPFKNIQHKWPTNQNPWNRSYAATLRDSAIAAPFKYDKVTRRGKALYFPAGSTVEIIDVEGAAFNYGINDERMKFREVSSITVEGVKAGSSNYYKNNSAMCYPGGDFVYIFGQTSAAATSTLYYTKINTNTGEKSQGTWALGTQVKIGENGASSTVDVYRTRQVQEYPMDGNYLYLPQATNNSSGYRDFIKFDVENVADRTTIPSNINEGTEKYVDTFDKLGFRPVKISDGLIIGPYYIINNDIIYSTTRFLPSGVPSSATTLATHCSVMYDGLMLSCSDVVDNGPVLNPYYLATINVLKNPVTKTSSQTMKITYTITEV